MRHTGSGYDEEIGSHTETGRQAEDLRHGLWAAASLLQVRFCQLAVTSLLYVVPFTTLP